MNEATIKLKENLKQSGWHLTKKGIDICKDDLGNKSGKMLTKDIINSALNINLSEIGEKILPDDLTKGKSNELKGPCVLQIMKICNTSAPKVNEESSVAPRLLQLHLSDGHKTCVAVEFNSFAKELSVNTPPGSKVCLNGAIKVQNGFLLLGSDNIRCLGGNVESLYNKWKSAKDASGFFRNVTDGDEAPPPFVPFGKTISYQCNTSNPSLQNSNKGDNDEEDKEFNDQRESAIAKVQQSRGDSSAKSFATGRNKQDQETPGYSRRNEDRQHQRDFGHGQSRNDSYRNDSNRNDSYRKPGNFKIDEDKCGQIVQMGFTRAAACGALRRHENNLEEALDSLLQSRESNPRNDSRGQRDNDTWGRRDNDSRGQRDNDSWGRRDNDSRGQRNNDSWGRRDNDSRGQRDNDSRGQRDNDSRGRRDNFRGRGGRRSNRGGKFDDGEDDSHHAPSATLFDYLETKMTSTAQKAKPQENARNKSTTEQNKSQLDEDDALQEQYLVEYAKELSLVETHGSQQYQLYEEPHSSDANPENSGVSKYRDGANSRTSRNNRREDEFENRKYQSNRTNQDRSGSNRFSKPEKSNSMRYDKNRSRDEPTGSNEPLHSREHRYNDRRQNHEPFNDFSDRKFNNDRGGNDRNTDSRRDYARNDDYNESRTYKNDTDRKRPIRNTLPDQKSKVPPRFPLPDQKSKVPPRFPLPDQKSKVPPRFQKKQEQRDVRRPTNSQSRDSGPRRNVTLGDTNQQMKNESSAAAAFDVYPVYDDNKSQEQPKPALNHSYQDQRQQTKANSDGRLQYNAGQRNDGYYPEDFRDASWVPGMTCQALYWEDRQYYRAAVMDVHPTLPTAVVQFVGYGNSEEVLFKDMRPDTIKPSLPDRGSYNGPTAGLEFTRGHKGPTRYPRDAERRGPPRPSKSLYQPPVPSK